MILLHSMHSRAISVALDTLGIFLSKIFLHSLHSNAHIPSLNISPETDQKISQIFKLLSNHLANHIKQHVNLALDSLSFIIAQSHQYLSCSFIQAIENIIILSQYEDPVISQAAHNHLKEFDSFKKTIESRFHDLLEQIPLDLKSNLSDDKKLYRFRLVNGYLIFFKGHGFQIQDHLSHFQRALEIDSSNVKIVQDKNISSHISRIKTGYLDSEAEALPISTDIIFKNFHQKNLKSEIGNFFTLWASFADSMQLSSFLNSLFVGLTENSINNIHCQTLWILSQTIQGIKMVNSDGSVIKGRKKIVRSIFKELVSMEYQNLPTNLHEYQLTKSLLNSQSFNHLEFFNKDESKNKLLNIFPKKEQNFPSKDIILADFHKNIIKLNLYMINITKISAILGDEFQPYLMDSLYSFLERLGDSNRIVSITAWKSLIDISKNMNIPGNSHQNLVSNLITSNIDYVVNSASRRLHYLRENFRAPKVLSASIRISGQEIINFMDESVLEIQDLLDEFHNVDESVVFALFEVFDAMVEVMTKNLPQISFPETSTNLENEFPRLQSKFGNASPLVIDFYLKNNHTDEITDKVEQKTPSEVSDFFKSLEISKNESSIEEEDSVLENKDKEPSITKNASFALKIISKSLNFLSVESPELRYYVMKIIKKSILLLQDAPQERDSYVYKIWTIILKRLHDQEIFIVLEAMLVISQLCRLSPEFVQNKVSDDLIKGMIKSLEKMDFFFKESSKSKSNCISKFKNGYTTADMKNYISTLKAIFNILEPIRLNMEDTLKLTKALIPLLNSKYPDKVQENAIEILQNLLSKDHKDAVWCDLWIAMNGKELEPKQCIHEGLHFKTLKTPESYSNIWNSISQDLLKNGSKLLNVQLEKGWTQVEIKNGIWKSY